jgi:hypothetical protein
VSPTKLESDGFSAPPLDTPGRASVGVSGKRVVITQLALVTAGAVAVGLARGSPGLLSALWGGGAAVAGSLAFFAVVRWGSQPAPTPWQALRAVVVAEVVKWAVSLSALAALLSGAASVEAVAQAPGAAVLTFCLAWVAPLLAWLTVRKHNA